MLSSYVVLVGLLCITAIPLNASSNPAENEIVAMVTSLRLPTISFEEASVQEVYAFLGQKVRDAERDLPSTLRGVSFLTTGLLPNDRRTIHYTRRNVDLGTLFQ